MALPSQTGPRGPGRARGIPDWESGKCRCPSAQSPGGRLPRAGVGVFRLVSQLNQPPVWGTGQTKSKPLTYMCMRINILQSLVPSFPSGAYKNGIPICCPHEILAHPHLEMVLKPNRTHGVRTKIDQHGILLHHPKKGALNKDTLPHRIDWCSQSSAEISVEPSFFELVLLEAPSTFLWFPKFRENADSSTHECSPASYGSSMP